MGCFSKYLLEFCVLHTARRLRLVLSHSQFLSEYAGFV